ncbi:ATP--guanido phosphotransferase [Leptospira wolffii]|uniref:ATP--guanido phosphotransferase n=1 Tax=Leptospira wolffii TaxID=409998 RepID=A0ABV5BN37_9LEPT|nr:ATP--guanido phosphotransferase [Leptospira wolffii]
MDGCIYCGVSRTEWKTHGRIGCAYCVTVFGEEFSQFIPGPAPMQWEPTDLFPQKDLWKRFSSLPLEIGLQKIDSYRLPFTYRYRVARNPKNSIYPRKSGKTDRFLSTITGEGEQEYRDEEKKGEKLDFRERIPWNSGTLLAGDEDHIRWEYVTDSLSELNTVLESDFLEKFWEKERFDFLEGIGFVTSCPTNSDQGDKLSVSLPASLAENGDLVGFRLPTDWGFYREERKDRLVFFRKNFGRNRKNSFFNLVSYLALLVIAGKEGPKATFAL